MYILYMLLLSFMFPGSFHVYNQANGLLGDTVDQQHTMTWTSQTILLKSLLVHQMQKNTKVKTGRLLFETTKSAKHVRIEKDVQRANCVALSEQNKNRSGGNKNIYKNTILVVLSVKKTEIPLSYHYCNFASMGTTTDLFNLRVKSE